MGRKGKERNAEHSLAAHALCGLGNKDAGVCARAVGIDVGHSLGIAAHVVEDVLTLLWMEGGTVAGGSQHVGVPATKAQDAIQIRVQWLIALQTPMQTGQQRLSQIQVSPHHQLRGSCRDTHFPIPSHSISLVFTVTMHSSR